MGRKQRVSTAQPALLSVADVAFQLGVCRQTVYNLIYRQGLPSVMLGGVRRVHPGSLGEWLRQLERA